MFATIKPTAEEVQRQLPGDELAAGAVVVMDRAFSLPAAPADVWPWFVQLGKNRSGWYLSRRTEHFILPSKRALWTIAPQLQGLKVGDVIDDWGGSHATFEVALLLPNQYLVHASKRGQTNVSWAITLWPEPTGTRVHIRLRLAPVRWKWLAKSGGEFIDALTIAGLAAGLHQRLLADKS